MTVGARETAVKLAAIKALEATVKSLNAEEKQALLEILESGDRKVAKLPDGTAIATVSVSTRSASWDVVDEQKFLAWVKENRPSAIVEQVRDSDRKHILSQIDETGELPDGVAEVPESEPYVTVRQSAEQRDAVVAAWRSGALELPNVAGEIES